MARTLSEITESINTAKDGRRELDAYNSPADTALWRVFRDAIAYIIWAHELLVEQVVSEYQNHARNAKAGSARWYEQLLQDWQNNHVLQWDEVERRYKYQIDDPEARLVEWVALRKGASPGEGTILVAKAASNGQPTALSATEKANLEAYLAITQGWTDVLTVRSQAADTVAITAEIYYEPQLNEAGVQSGVELAISDYLNKIRFGGRYLRDKLIDAIQAVPGVTSVVLSGTTITDVATGTTVNNQREHLFTAGYAVWDSGNSALTLTAE